MPSNLDEPYYCSQQINIPPSLPDILKQFTKAAIRTQPKDVLAWSSAYFRAMSKGETPPVKERLEMPVATQKTDTGLTPGLLRIMNKQLFSQPQTNKLMALMRQNFPLQPHVDVVVMECLERESFWLGPKKTVPLHVVEEKWTDLALPKEQFDDIIRIGSFGGDVEWNKFFSIACTTLGETLTDAMKLVCEILTADPEGGPARIPFPLFKDLYTYMAQIDGDVSQQQINDVISFLKYDVDKQDGYVQPRNFLSPECPKLSSTSS